MIKITKAAQKHFINLLSKQEYGTNIRVFVINPGTPTAECGISYCPPGNVAITDTEIKFKKLSVYVDEISFPHLEKAEIDLISANCDTQLTIKAPNAKIYKIPKNVPLIEQVKYFLQSQINPQLAHHGGKASVVEITNDGYVVLHFDGGCNGCSMIDITLKNGIEKELLIAFPTLKGVDDSTKHRRGKHSYY